MFERILLAVDGSEHSALTVPVAADLAKKYGATVTVLHVREFTKRFGADVEIDPENESQAFVDRVLAELRGEGVDARGEVRRVPAGQVPREIVDVAGDEEAGLIVMGTRGRTEWQSLLVGGVAHKVMAHATCPVLLVR
ncbi:MAG: universal stress protein [Actinobacteria bacterium]|nr:universal stress protein [Actinomycetota bacterium]